MLIMTNREPAGVFQRYVAQAINAERAARKMTAKDLQREAQVPDRTYRRAMDSEGTFDLDQLSRIADALRVKMSYLLLDAEARRERDPNAEAHAMIEREPGLTRRMRNEQHALLDEVRTTGTGDASGSRNDVASPKSADRRRALG